jgi:hypothetical protein
MTPEQIHTMSAGRETDAAVHSALGYGDECSGPMEMIEPDGDGGVWPACTVCDYQGWDTPTHKTAVPCRSSDIAAAFEMEAEIERRELAREYSDELQVLIENQTGRCRRFDYCHASPLDRCKAALLVLAGRQEGR